MQLPTLLTAADVGRLANRAPESVRLAADEGRITIAARTPNGTRLFTREAAEAFAARARVADEQRHRATA